jgi:hypothetical protein
MDRVEIHLAGAEWPINNSELLRQQLIRQTKDQTKIERMVEFLSETLNIFKTMSPHSKYTELSVIEFNTVFMVFL